MKEIKQSQELYKIGSIVAINLDQIGDRLPQKLSKALLADPKGTVIDYKMTDGTDIGFFLKLESGITCWFFEKELEGQIGINSTENFQKRISRSLVNNYVSPPSNKSSNILDLMNPINFLKWCFYSSKDIF